jgi:hypothetical protein
MTRSDDSTHDMANRITSVSADRLLTGAAQPEPDDHVHEVTRLLAALRTPMASAGAREQEAVAAFAGAVTAAPTKLDDVRTARHAHRRTARIAVATAAFVVLGSTAAAAATGSLPDTAQSAVSKALSHVSVDVPDPDASHASDHTGPVGPDATGSAHRGLCIAWASRGRADPARGASGDATAFSNLRRAARDDGKLVKEFCADVLDGTSAADDPSGSGTDPGTSGADHGRSGEDHGNAGDAPAPVDTPNGGGISTGTEASNGANQGGVDHASDAAQQGSANADAHGKPADTPSTTNGSSHSGH